MLRSRLVGLGAVFALFFAASAREARAQAILLPVEGDAALVPAHEAELRAALTDELEARGEEVAFADELVSAEALSGLNWCNECITRLLRERDAARAVVVALWGEGGAPEVVSVTLVDPEGQTADAEASVEGRTLRDALREALAGALAAWPTRAGVLVRFVGAPVGAAVLVDRYPFGTLPAHGRLAPGPHVVSLVSDGEVVVRREIDVAASETPLEFDLGGAETMADGERGRGWLAGPIVLSLGAAGLAALPVHGLLREDCIETVRGFCVAEERVVHGRALAYASASAALAVTAGIWSIVGARRHRAPRGRVEIGLLAARVRF